ncbi:MAG: STAS domain-containing protein [Clostridia bacterium]|jgi:anti-sigma B factor antagonist|nr:STAS domain-containing protein [Clostridia bacterium]
MLNIDGNFQKDSAVLKLEGRLDTVTAPELESKLRTALPDLKSLVFDFEKLDYISSAGLRVLLSAQKTMNVQGEMKVINVNQAIMDIFEITGFLDILTVEPAETAE